MEAVRVEDDKGPARTFHIGQGNLLVRCGNVWELLDLPAHQIAEISQLAAISQKKSDLSA
jgi:hypothetical protein